MQNSMALPEEKHIMYHLKDEWKNRFEENVVSIPIFNSILFSEEMWNINLLPSL